MNRLFGSGSSKPKPSLNDAISAVRFCHLNGSKSFVSIHFQIDTRSQSIEVKIRKLDAELGRYKEQLAKLRNGPGKVKSHVFAQVAATHVCVECSTGTRHACVETEEDVRGAIGAAHAASIQYGICHNGY